MRLARLLDRRRVAALLRLDQALVVLDRELGVDRQPDHRAVALARQANGEIDALAAVRARRDIRRELVGRQHLLEQRGQLHLAPGAARLDVGQHALEVADAGRQRLHLAQAAMHLLEPLADQLERFAEALFERGVQLFVDGAAHLLELAGIVGLDCGQPALDGHFQALEAFVEAQ